MVQKPKPTKKNLAWLIGRYLYDPLSPFHKLKPDTQKSYKWECNRIRETIGERLVDPAMPERYRRSKQINAQKVVESRQQHRKRAANEACTPIGTKNRNE